MPRIKELDYLRGLAALGIMLYHYKKWLYIYEGAQTIEGRISVYGVEIFYILSGITLYHVYKQTLHFNKVSFQKYFTKRFFRIFPLFWLSIALTIIIGLKHIPMDKLLLNVTGLFSLVAWDGYIAPGTWSIGNELVFYLIFPFLLLLYQKHKLYFVVTGLIFLLLFHYFAFFMFKANDTLHNQWTNYVNPLNHLLLFFVGMSIPIFFKQEVQHKYLPVLLIVFGTIILFTLPSGNDGIDLLYGLNRWAFSIASILICLGFYQLNANLPPLLDEPLKKLGEISYGIYLLHPFVYQLMCMLIRKMDDSGFQMMQSNALLIFIAVSLTLIVSYIVYHYFERYFIKKGNTIIANFYKS